MNDFETVDFFTDECAGARPLPVFRSSAFEVPGDTRPPIQGAGRHRLRGGARCLQGPRVLVVRVGGRSFLRSALRRRTATTSAS